MGSAATEECSQRRVNGCSGGQLQRPVFYSCHDCGRKFTKRALEVHKQSCSENENCQCVVCKISKTKLLFKEDYILLDTRQSGAKKLKTANVNFPNLLKNSQQYKSPPTKNVHKLNIPVSSDTSDVNQQVYNLPDTPNSSNSSLNNGIVDSDTDLPSTDDKSKDQLSSKSDNANDASTVISKDELINDGIIKAALNTDDISEVILTSNGKIINESVLDSASEEDISINSAKSESATIINNTQNSIGISDNQHFGEPCSRKIFCVICNDHVEWKCFAMHALDHCIKVENNRIQCPLCSDSRSSPTYFLMHFYSHISVHPSDCADCRCDNPKCLESSAIPLSEHCYAESNEHRCYICLKYFSHFQTLVNHMRLHSKEMPFSCKECLRSFRQIGNLQRHMSTHRGERPFKCEKCTRSFADPATLRNHYRVHTKETPYVCTSCDRGFSQIGNLKRHMALHVQKGVRDAYVKIVDEEKGVIMKKGATNTIPKDGSTGSSTNTVQDGSSKNTDGAHNNVPANPDTRMRRQGRRKNNFDLHVCAKCGKKYTWKHDLDIHFRTHTGEKPFKCEVCDKRFAQSGAVRIHKIRHHATPAQIKERMRKKDIKGLPSYGLWISK